MSTTSTSKKRDNSKVVRKSNLTTHVTAQHTTRTDVYGDPLTKEFPVDTWRSIPGRHYADKDGIHKISKGGWVETGATSKREAPQSLKKVRPVKPGDETPAEVAAEQAPSE